MNPLYVKFENDNTTYIFYVALGNKIADIKSEIEDETNRTIVKASYDKSQLN